MLLDVDEFLCDARRHSAAHAFRSDAIEQPSLHIFSGVEITCTRPGQAHDPGRIVQQQLVTQNRDLVGGRRSETGI